MARGGHQCARLSRPKDPRQESLHALTAREVWLQLQEGEPLGLFGRSQEAGYGRDDGRRACRNALRHDEALDLSKFGCTIHARAQIRERSVICNLAPWVDAP